MSALARAAVRTAATRQGIAFQALRPTSAPPARSFWGSNGNGNSGHDWYRRWADRLGKETASNWEKNAERLSREMEAHSKAVADKIRAYMTRGEGESYIDPSFKRERTQRASTRDCRPNKPATPHPEARPLSETQVRDLVQARVKDTLDVQFFEVEDRLRRLVKDQSVVHAASVRSIIDDWVRRSPGFTKAVAEEVDTLLSKKTAAAAVDPPRLREALAKELLSPELVDMLNKALGHTSNSEVCAMVSAAVRDHAASPQLLALVRREIDAAAVVPRPELERITKDTCEHVVQKHKAYGQKDLDAKLADMRWECVDLVDQYLNANKNKLRDMSQTVEAFREQLRTLDAKVEMLRAQGENGTLDGIIDARIAAAAHESAGAPASAKTERVESEGARLEPALDRQLSSDPKEAASCAAPLGDAAAAGPSKPSPSQELPASPKTASNMAPPSFKIVHYDPATQNIRIETPQIPGNKDSAPPSSSVTMRASQSTLTSVHSEMRRHGYSVICRGDHVTVFGRGPVDLGRSPVIDSGNGDASSSAASAGEGGRHGGRRRVVVRTALLSAAGFLIIWWVHDIVMHEIRPRQVGENNHGMRAFKEFGGPGQGFARPVGWGCSPDAAIAKHHHRHQQQQQLDDEFAALCDELGRIFDHAASARAK
jgi:hypothetical protein